MGKLKNSYAELISSSQIMIEALKKNEEKLSKRGIDETFINEMKEVFNGIQQLNEEQEKLKADLKSKTEALNKRIDDLWKKYSEAKS
jgi:hypothetical protein